MPTFTRALSFAAFFYPAYWLAMAVVLGLPPLLTDGFSAESWKLVWVSPLFVGVSRLAMYSELTVAVMLAAALAGWFARPQPLAGLFVASLGHVALRTPIGAALFGRRPQWAALAAAALVLAAGLWRLAQQEEGGYGRRLGFVTVAFVLPVCLFLWLSAPNPRMIGAWALPAVAAALIAPALPRRARMAELAPPAWRAVAAGVLVSALTAGFGHATGTRLREAREAERKTSVDAVRLQLPAADPAQPYPKLFFQKGVNFTAEGPVGYRPDYAAHMLDRLRAQGVDSIALVPYGFMRHPQDPAIHWENNRFESRDDMEVVARLAQARGMRVMLKPQIWLGRGGFPGVVRFDNAEDRAQWFANYMKFAESFAKLAKSMHADIYCVGVELRHMAMFDGEWRKIVGRVRDIYPGPLVYAATQGEEFESVRFWDALDFIGLNNYYPLSDGYSAEEALKKVEDVQRRYQKPVIFPEAGFASLKDPHKAPWDETYREWSGADQARAYEAVFRAFYSKPWFYGVYWWKVGTNGGGGDGDFSHSPWRKPAMDVVARWYREGGR